MGDTKDVKALPESELQQIKTEAVAAALPYIDAAQKAYNALKTFTTELDTKYHPRLQKSLLDELELQKEIGNLKKYLSEGESYESRKEKIQKAKPGEFNRDISSWLTEGELKKRDELNGVAYDTQKPIEDAVGKILIKHGLEYNPVNGNPADESNPAESLKRSDNNVFRNTLISNLISPITTTEPKQGPGNTPAPKPTRDVKVGK